MFGPHRGLRKYSTVFPVLLEPSLWPIPIFPATPFVFVI